MAKIKIKYDNLSRNQYFFRSDRCLNPVIDNPYIMKQYHPLPLVFSLTIFLGACINDQPDEPITIVEPPLTQLISTDTISSGSYLGFTIGEDAEETYSHVNALKVSPGVTYLNIVGNVFDGLTGLEERMHLYQTIFLDRKPGSDSGVQLTLTDGRVSSIFLNSGKELTQWPEKPHLLPAVRLGDGATALYPKLEKISADKAYRNRFEYVSLLTKDLSKPYDPPMADAPQWYFAYTLEDNRMDEVKLSFEEGRLKEILVNHYRRY